MRPCKSEAFRFLHGSADGVYGSLADDDGLFTERTAYPSSPYSASNAAADHLLRAWHRTCGLPTIISNCSNNYGPFHLPEKLIPLMILNACEGKAPPVYGVGSNIRDWLYVDNHARALNLIAVHGRVGEKYNVGGNECSKNTGGAAHLRIDGQGSPCPARRTNGSSGLSRIVSRTTIARAWSRQGRSLLSAPRTGPMRSMRPRSRA